MKRGVDVAVSAAGLIAASPVMLAAGAAIWFTDRGSPLFISIRCGRGGVPFKILKFRTMFSGAHLTGVSSTSNSDPRITPVGRVLRAVKVDELPQLVNVLRGDMSLVGPRPNIQRAIQGYSADEREMLTVRPGITDFASIVFADEGAVLADSLDPDLTYEQLIRPGKSRLALFYVSRHTTRVDVQIMWLTALNSWNRPAALRQLAALLERLGAPADLVRIASRQHALEAAPPPGMTEVVQSVDTPSTSSLGSALPPSRS